jgi:YegS C-terminal NAD kinase beta sandwich-like domain
MIRPGEEWGGPAESPPDRDIDGDDQMLAACVARFPGALVRFHPAADSDVARAVGIHPGSPATGRELPLDALQLDDGTLGCNMVVLGRAPDRLRRIARRIGVHVAVDGKSWVDGAATTVVVATGQFLRGLDVVPRGHPGDGRAEVQVYQLRPSERRAMRARLAVGAHVPHPRIQQRSAQRVEIVAERPLALEVDGRPHGHALRLVVEVRSAAYRLLI